MNLPRIRELQFVSDWPQDLGDPERSLAFDEQASYSGADLLLPGGLLLRLDAHKVAVERLGIVLRYRGPYIHVGDRLTNQLYSTNPDACDKRTLCM